MAATFRAASLSELPKVTSRRGSRPPEGGAPFRYLAGAGARPAAGEAPGFTDVQRALAAVGVGDADAAALWACLAGVLQLGEVLPAPSFGEVDESVRPREELLGAHRALRCQHELPDFGDVPVRRLANGVWAAGSRHRVAACRLCGLALACRIVKKGS